MTPRRAIVLAVLAGLILAVVAARALRPPTGPVPAQFPGRVAPDLAPPGGDVPPADRPPRSPGEALLTIASSFGVMALLIWAIVWAIRRYPDDPFRNQWFSPRDDATP